MQIRFAAFIAVIIYVWHTVEGARIDTSCRKWECQLGVGQGKSAEARPCSVANYNMKNGTVGVEDCEAVGYLCDAPNEFIKNETCYKYGVLKWKRGLPAGDSCTQAAECTTGVCNESGGKKTCSGKNYTDTCASNNECYPGLFCNSTKKCDNVKAINATCGAGDVCAFSSICANGRCTRFGAFSVGTQFYINFF